MKLFARINPETQKKEALRWKKQRQRGWLRYVIMTGGLWGLFMLVGTTLSELFAGSYEEVLADLPDNLIRWTIFGFLFGNFMWIGEQSRLRKYLARPGDTETP
ncbi:MAG: hypothetical protein EOP85_00795 [Verrucomicrobiaceae bacterium]|nr:MAG: hypothetical protein EOP85_00795 [Verrucomicrobiaceae bacterium]